MSVDWLSLVGGALIGCLVMGLLLWKLSPALMLLTYESQLPFDETVEALAANAKAAGWQVPKVYELQKSLAKDGYHITPVKVLSICNTRHAARVLEDDRDKPICALMPCRIGVYQDRQGKVYVAAMNTALLSKLFGPKVAKVMEDVAAEEHKMLQGIIAQ